MTEREVAEKMIADAEKMATEGKAKLAELDKPTFRNGDYGTYSKGELWWVWERNGVLELFGAENGSGWNTMRPEKRIRDGMVKLGNSVDDLKLNRKDFTNWDSSENDALGSMNETININTASEVDKYPVWICMEENRNSVGAWFTIKNAIKIHQKLGHAIAHAKRKERNNDI